MCLQFCWTSGSCPMWVQPRPQRWRVMSQTRAICWTGPPHQQVWRWEEEAWWRRIMWLWFTLKATMAVSFLSSLSHALCIYPLLKYNPCTYLLHPSTSNFFRPSFILNLSLSFLSEGIFLKHQNKEKKCNQVDWGTTISVNHPLENDILLFPEQISVLQLELSHIFQAIRL